MTREPRRRALLVGVAEYQNFTGLPSVAVDLEVMAEVLGDSAIGGFDDVAPLLDPDAATLRLRITEFLADSEPDDLNVIYVSGHGLRKAENGEFHIVANDTNRDDLAETAVSAGFLNERLAACRARQRVLILDSCESGGFTTGFTTERAAKRAEDEPLLPLKLKGVYILASSQARETSWAGRTANAPSMFTGELVKALRTGEGDRDRDGRIGVAELSEHLSLVFSARPEESRQTPVSSSLAVSGGSIYLARTAVRRTDPFPGRRKPAGPDSAGLDATQGGPVRWKRLLEYYAQCLTAENAEDELLMFDQGSKDVAYLGGPEQFLSGAGADQDGTFPVPDEYKDRIDDHNLELLYGYPVLILRQDAAGKTMRPVKCAPLLIRRLEVVRQDDGSERLRPYGEPEPNPLLCKKWLSDDEADRLLQTYSPTWGVGDHNGLKREINHLLRDVFSLQTVQPIEPTRLTDDLEVRSAQSGALNTAVLMTLKSAKTVKGLLADLSTIAGKKEKEIPKTALGSLLDGTADSVVGTAVDPVMIGPMNDAQREVLHAAMTRRLTVATGPPGTGKSALIVNIVATAVAAGQRVLVASTNNAAVDEVWKRCEALLPGLIVRTGSSGTNGGTNYRAAERDTLWNALADAAKPARMTEATAEATYSEAVRREQSVYQGIARKAETETALLAAGQRRAAALSALGFGESAQNQGAPASTRLRALPDPELTRVGARGAKLARARWFAAGRRRRFLQGLDVASTPESSATLCETVSAYADSESTWQSLTAHVHAGDEELSSALSSADKRHNDDAANLVESRLRALHIRGRSVLQSLLDHPADTKASDWGKVLAVLAAAPAWAVTCLSASRFPPNPGIFDLVVVDEASQCSIPAVLPVLFRAKRAVVIGDPLQLPHVTTMKTAEDAAIRAKHGLDSADFVDTHLTYRADSAFHALEHAAGGSLTLNEHYRCHPDIARLSDSLFYAPRGKPLTILTPSQGLRAVPGERNVRWLDQPGKARLHHRGSWVNDNEVERVGKGIGFLLTTLPADATIGVVTPFRAQAAQIRAQWSGQTRVRVGTAHAFQGGECDAVIFSLVAADGIGPKALNFLDGQANLWNVAITRARAHLFVIGDRDFWIRRGGLGLRLLNEIDLDRQNPQWPHGKEFSDLLFDRLGGRNAGVAMSELRDGYVADAAVPAVDGSETAFILDTGVPPGTGPGSHLQLQLKRTALLASAEKRRHAQRLPAWQLYREPE